MRSKCLDPKQNRSFIKKRPGEQISKQNKIERSRYKNQDPRTKQNPTKNNIKKQNPNIEIQNPRRKKRFNTNKI